MFFHTENLDTSGESLSSADASASSGISSGTPKAESSAGSSSTGGSDEPLIMRCPSCKEPYYVKTGHLVYDMKRLDVAFLDIGSAPCYMCEHSKCESWE